MLRAEYNWSQAELAERGGVSRQTINAIETEKYDPSLPLAFALARLFGKPIEEIFLYRPTASPARAEPRREPGRSASATNARLARISLQPLSGSSR